MKKDEVSSTLVLFSYTHTFLSVPRTDFPEWGYIPWTGRDVQVQCLLPGSPLPPGGHYPIGDVVATSRPLGMGRPASSAEGKFLGLLRPRSSFLRQPASHSQPGTKPTVPAPASTSSQGPSQPQISSGFSLPPPTGGGPGTTPNAFPACRLSGGSL